MRLPRLDHFNPFAEVCTTSMQEEGYDEDAIRNEVAVIRVQLAFVLQLTGDTDSMAQGLLDDVLKAPYVHTLSLLISFHAKFSDKRSRG